MNWVKAGATFGGMNRSFAGATPPAIPKPEGPKLTGDASGGLGAPKPAVPNAAAPPSIPKPVGAPPVPNPPTQPTTGGQFWGPSVGAGMSGFLGNLGTPQGFASAAGMMPGAFQALGRVGGMPAVMGVYQYLKSMRGGPGAHDWDVLTNPNYKAATVKRAADPWLELALQGSTGIGRMPQTPSTPPQAPPEQPQTDSGVLGTLIKERGMDLARREAMTQAISRTAPLWGPRLGAEAAHHIPGIKGGLLWETPVNMAEDAGDFAGVMPHWAGGKGDTLWFKSQRDQGGNIQYGENGAPQGTSGWNPSAFGNWDVRGFNRDTTPNGRWGFNMVETGKPWLDEPMSYTGSSLNAFQHPLKGLHSLEKFRSREMNPLADWDAILHPSRLSSTGFQPQTIPGTLAQYAALRTDQPAEAAMPGGKYFESERQHWRGRYHPVYNPNKNST